MTDWLSDQLKINNTSIHYTRTNGDKPPLLLVHGMTDNGLRWSRVAEALETTYDVIMPDARGHGHSPGPNEPYSASLHADDLAHIIDVLALDRPAVIGHSMGAINVSLLASRYHDKMRAIVLVDPGWSILPGTTIATTENGKAFIEDYLSRIQTSRDELIAETTQRIPEMLLADIETLVDARLQFDVRGFDLYEITPLPWQSIIPNIQCPVLLVTADTKLGAQVTPEMAQEAQTLKPDLLVEHIANAGHSPHGDQLEAFLDVIHPFLDNAYS